MTDLAPYNTFRVSAKAKDFLVVRQEKDIPQEPFLILGEGANVLFTKDIPGLVIKNELKGRKVVSQDDDSVTLEVASGESWIDLVNFAVENGWSGIENMAFIPGTVGAATVGNIAAYGESFEDVFVEAKSLKEKFSKADCNFGYRDSVFKNNRQDVFITSVTIKLSKKPAMDTAYYSRYESLKTQLGEPPYTPKMVAAIVTRLRQSKLPDWHQLGTAGSFFKNPLVSAEKAHALQKEITELQTYPAEKLQYTDRVTGNFVKVPAGRLLDELGWKGKRIGNVGTWKNHALTVINYGGATGQEILDFTNQMSADIKSHFEIDLEPEVNIL